eukprot:GHVU01093554.1.p1 GENE.GHVU01093554.1~~GHVU01093554.1.p1  ORF type:complete len:138 (+),score=4.54 GHVU01093554.1:96-509(+)
MMECTPGVAAGGYSEPCAPHGSGALAPADKLWIRHCLFVGVEAQTSDWSCEPVLLQWGHWCEMAAGWFVFGRNVAAAVGIECSSSMVDCVSHSVKETRNAVILCLGEYACGDMLAITRVLPSRVGVYGCLDAGTHVE